MNLSGPRCSIDSHASRMFALGGLTPFFSVVNSHRSGRSSLLPPTNAESWAFGSGLWRTRPSASLACQSTQPAAASSSWFPSAP